MCVFGNDPPLLKNPNSEAETSTADLGGRMALHYASSQTLDMFWPLEGVNSTTGSTGPDADADAGER